MYSPGLHLLPLIEPAGQVLKAGQLVSTSSAKSLHIFPAEQVLQVVFPVSS